ncbi:MAG TPA: hypothetical protein VFM57_05825 [Thermoleophilaceae bacterium]|nr:hypothetical protein [Thermoleophilaceae bacterium]
MAQLVVLVPADRGEIPLGSDTVAELARLGVTTVSLARDEHTSAVILEGWAFDPSRPDAAVDALGAAGQAQTLQPILHMAVTTAAREGGP